MELNMIEQSINVILNGIKASLEPDGIDKEEVKILKEKDERRKEYGTHG